MLSSYRRKESVRMGKSWESRNSEISFVSSGEGGGGGGFWEMLWFWGSAVL